MMRLVLLRGLALIAPLALMLQAETATASSFFDVVGPVVVKDGNGVFDGSGGSYTGAEGENVFDPLAVTSLDGAVYALGGDDTDPGSIVLGLTGGFADGAGADLILYDSFGLSEGFVLEVSQDGVTFLTVGTFDGSSAVALGFDAVGNGNFDTFATSVDIAPAGLSSANFIRISSANLVVFNYPQAYDLDAVEALYPAGVIPEPSSAVLLGLGGLGLLGIGIRRRRRVGRS